MESMGIAITDAKGNFVGLSGLVDNISKSMEGMTDTQKAANLAALVGTEAVSGFLALMEAGPKKIDEMTASLEGSEGASKKAADQMKAGIGGALEEMSGAIESLVISIGDQLAPAVQTVAVWLSKLLNWFNKMPEGMKKTLVIITAIIGGISLLISGFGLLLGFVGLVS
ncbi:phage tail tape measure protein, partial [Niallia circulans]